MLSNITECDCETSPEIALFRNRTFDLRNMSAACIEVLPTCTYLLGGRVILGLILSVIAIGTFFGNVLVVMAVALVKKLQNPSNMLIVSLAFSDLLVGLLVIPVTTIYQLMSYFPFNEASCSFWTSCDLLLCTSSILNLCAISIDRYLVITKPFEYAVKRTPLSMGLMIAAVWMLSACISIPPLFSQAWKDEFHPGYCEYPTKVEYQLYAVFVAFYLPLIVMIILYGNIFKLARKMAKADEKQKVLQHVKQDDRNLIDEQLPNNNGQAALDGAGARPSIQSTSSDMQKRRSATHKPAASRKKSSSDTKAIKTLGVIMGCFTVCWLPFFIMQLVRAVYQAVEDKPLIPNDHMFALFLWLGYFNSFLNPIIYAKFNKDFRMPFKHILLGHCKSINNRLRAEQYAEQYGLTGNSRKASTAAAGGRHHRRSSDVNTRRARHNLDTEDKAEHAL